MSKVICDKIKCKWNNGGFPGKTECMSDQVNLDVRGACFTEVLKGLDREQPKNRKNG